MNEPLIPMQVINPLTPSISSMPNSILNISTEAAMHEFDLLIDDSSSFIDVSEKDDAANYDDNADLHRAKENNENQIYFDT